MPTTVNKHRVLNQLFTSLKKRYTAVEPEARPVLEQFVYAICREGTTREKADLAYRRLQEHFFDWNEVRVSSSREIEEAIGQMPFAEARAGRLISFLQEVFETTFSFDLESLHKKGVKQAAKQLARFQAASDYAVSYVVQHSLDGHALPLDEPSLKTLRRIGLIDEDSDDLEAIRASLEHLVPKARGSLFCELISAIAHDDRWEDEFPALAGGRGSESSNGSGLSSAAPERAGRPKPR